MTHDNDLEPQSPCIRHCCLDNNDTCIGCYRTLDNILNWHKASDAQKKQIITQCEQRKKRHKDTFLFAR